jgi:hypothetical protein
MQKVVGSSPIIRSTKAPLDGVFCCLRIERRDWKWLASAFLCLNKSREGLGVSPLHCLFVPK